MANIIPRSVALSGVGYGPTAMATLGYIPIDLSQHTPVKSGGGGSYYVIPSQDVTDLKQFENKYIIVVVLDGVEYRSVVDRTWNINNIGDIRVEGMEAEALREQLFVNILDTSETKSLVKTQLIEVKNEQPGSIKVEII